jgi:hypothetical protein
MTTCDLNADERDLLSWLGEEEFSQYGECLQPRSKAAPRSRRWRSDTERRWNFSQQRRRIMNTTTKPRPRDLSITSADKLRCVERELKWRYRVYPRRVAEGQMTERHMNREIAVMEEIAADLRAEIEGERLV